jgi:hypothetical protein
MSWRPTFKNSKYHNKSVFCLNVYCIVSIYDYDCSYTRRLSDKTMLLSFASRTRGLSLSGVFGSQVVHNTSLTNLVSGRWKITFEATHTETPRQLVAGISPRRPGSMWDLWWTKWHSDWFFSEFFGFLSSISLHRGSSHPGIEQGDEQ